MRLKKVLGGIISQSQGAFVAGRSIAYNILLYQDLVKHYTRKSCSPSCLIKVDLRKAYNTLDWNFIHDMLVGLNFPYHFIKMAITCISTTSYTLLVNGEPFEIFHPKRGLRQGDPMSPLLFVIGMEYLSRMLNVVS